MRVFILRIFKICVFLFLCLCLFIVYCSFFTKTNKTYRTPEQYSAALNSFKKNDILHLPRKIPANAKNVRLYAFISNFNGKILLLQFDINKEYIEQEFKKTNFINADFPVGEKQQIYNMPSDNKRINTENMTFYVINNEENKAVDTEYFPYFSGIGVNKKLTTILYYYIEPED